MTDDPVLRTLSEALADLTRWLDEERIGGVIIGGVAVSLLARPRLTRDIDAIVLGDDIGWERLIESAQHFGIAPRIDDPLGFAASTRVLLLRHRASSIDLDVSLGALPFERDIVKHASLFKVGELALPLPRIEDLIVMKALARRPRDWTDIEALLDVHPAFDIDFVRRWLREFASILEMPEIQDDFEAMLRRKRLPENR